jgi:hypothetical protein
LRDRRPSLFRARPLAEPFMSKVVQMGASIARHGSAVPTHLHLMRADAGNYSGSGRMLGADADDAVAQRESTSRCGVHDHLPIISLARPRGSRRIDGRRCSETALPFPLWRLPSGPRSLPTDPGAGILFPLKNPNRYSVTSKRKNTAAPWRTKKNRQVLQ